jgi:bisphosphoglycerate-dependent phosphoglycerate mutase family 1
MKHVTNHYLYLATGYSKPHVESQLGSVVKDWRRGFSARPPAMDASHPHWEKINLDPRYRGVDVPVAESLEDTQKRVMEYWHDAILPDVAQGKKAIVVAHANTLRALIHELDGLNDESIRDVNIPTGRPFAYFLGDDMKPRGERDSHGFRGKYIDEMMRVDPATCLSFAHEQKVSCFEQWALDPLELQTECLVPQLPEGCQVDLT